VRDWVLDEPTGAYARKAWFLYEFLTGQSLDLANAKAGTYTDVLDPKRHIVGARITSSRHRVWDTHWRAWPPDVSTQKLTPCEQALDKEVRSDQNRNRCPLPRLSYLYTKETKSTFEIENEHPSPQREERFRPRYGCSQVRPSSKAALIAFRTDR
jgi:hypothetical protein